MEESARKRRAVARGQTACNPCRLRKVRCSYQLPCRTCVDREHPELCVYGPPTKRVLLEPAPDARQPSDATTGPWVPSKQEWDSLISRVARLESALAVEQSPETPVADPPGLTKSSGSTVEPSHGENYVQDPATGENVYLGGNSVLAMAAKLANSDESDVVRGAIGNSMLPMFALENNTATYPFVGIWDLTYSTTEKIQRLCALLPTNSECLNFIQQYRDNAHVLFPAIIDMDQFEEQVSQFLIARTKHAVDMPLDDQRIYGQSLHWMGLFFACMSSGCQCSQMERKEQQLTSQVYVCCAYECLRLINYLSCSKLGDIQTLLILGNVISNSTNAGVAWTLLGLTIRIAQGLGLHDTPPEDISDCEAHVRHEIWSRIVWQDSLLSITYDRATSTTSTTRWGSTSLAEERELSYADCMLKLCHIALDLVGSRASSTNKQRQKLQMDQRIKELDEIEQKSCGHIRETSSCSSRSHFLEHWNWRMHRSYVISELCRPMLTNYEDNQEGKHPYRSLCIKSLVETLDAFLHLHNLTAFAMTSWAAVHRALSSALLLALLKEPKKNEQVRILIDKLITAMSNKSCADASEVSAPVGRAITALSRLNMTTSDHDSDGVSGSSPHAKMYNILWGSSPDL